MSSEDVKGGAFTELFQSKYARVIEFFMVHEGNPGRKWDHNQKDLCEILEMYPSALRPILKKLEEISFIQVTRKIAKSRFYAVNPDCKFLTPLRKLLRELAFYLAEQEAE